MKSSFILHIDSLCILDKMTDEQAGKFIKALYQHQTTDTLPELELLLEMAVAPFINQFARDKKEYQKTCEKNRKNGIKGGRKKRTTETQTTQPPPVGLSSTPESLSEDLKNKNPLPKNPKNPDAPDNDSDNDNDSDSKKDKRKRFIKPSIEQVKKYFIEKSSTETEAEVFYDHYESNGWLVGGKSKMSDWKAAVRNWVRNNQNWKKTPVVPMQGLASTGTSGRPSYNPNDPKHQW